MRKFLRGVLECLARPLYSGIGAIVCMHRVVPREQRSILADQRALELLPEELEALLRFIRKRGYETIPLDELPLALAKPRRRKFVAFTFDDGCLDNLTNALPIFRAFDAPFTVNVTTSFVSHTGLAWWLLFEELFQRLDRICYHDGSRDHELPLRTEAEKNHACEQLTRFIRDGDQAGRDQFIQALFSGSGLDPVALSAKYMMDWDGVRQLASDSLVTIGAHCVNHWTLNRLAPEQLRSEMLDSKTILEAELKRPIRHLAYPFGGGAAVGPREFEAASECGFTTAVTTRLANLFPEHAKHLHCLPRINISGNYPAVPQIRGADSGLLAVRLHGFRRVIV